MTKKNALYTAGTIVCVIIIGGIAFYLNKSNSSAGSNIGQSPLAQANSQQQEPIASQTAPSGTPPDNANSASDASTGTPGRGSMPNIPAGQKPFFGQVASVSGSTLTVTTHTMNRGGSSANGTSATAASAGTTSTITVTLTSSTTFSGGTQDSLASGTKIFGYGTSNSDGSITATNIQINPTRPTGSHGGGQ